MLMFSRLKSKQYICLYIIFKMEEEKEKDAVAFYDRLKNELDLSNTWPAIYLFKFIVPSENENVLQVQKAFDAMGAVIKTTKSKTGKFTSISVNVSMNSADAIIEKYKELATIKGIVSL